MTQNIAFFQYTHIHIHLHSHFLSFCVQQTSSTPSFICSISENHDYDLTPSLSPSFSHTYPPPSSIPAAITLAELWKITTTSRCSTISNHFLTLKPFNAASTMFDSDQIRIAAERVFSLLFSITARK